MLRHWRSTRGKQKQIEQTEPDAIEPTPVILRKPLKSGGTVRATRLKTTAAFVQDIFVPDLTPPRFRLSVGPGGSSDSVEWVSDEVLTVDATAEDVEELLLRSPIADELHHVEFGDGQRWKVVYDTDSPQRRLIQTDEDPRVLILDTKYVDAGEDVGVSTGLPLLQELVAGTMAWAVNVAADGWILTSFETPPPVEEQPDVTPGGYVDPFCQSRQVIPQGASSDCSACGPNDTPEAFTVGYDLNIPAQNSEFNEWVIEQTEDTGPQDGVNVNAPIVHDSGCDFASDTFAADSLSWNLTIQDTTPPSAALVLTGSDGNEWTDGLKLTYHNKEPFDALGRTTFVKITHQSTNGAKLSRGFGPTCVAVLPWTQPCYATDEDVAEIVNRSPFNCVAYWTATFQDQQRVAGPREQIPDEDLSYCTVGCLWPTYSGGMRVEFRKVVCGFTSQGDSSPFEWWLDAFVEHGSTEYRYRRHVRGSGHPNCFGVTLSFDRDMNAEDETATERPEDLPQTITLLPWTG